VAARFAVLADNHVRQSIVEALRRAGGDTGEMVESFEAIAGKSDAFAYPIEYIKPRR
jgi:hypothetical protein